MAALAAGIVVACSSSNGGGPADGGETDSASGSPSSERSDSAVTKSGGRAGVDGADAASSDAENTAQSGAQGDASGAVDSKSPEQCQAAIDAMATDSASHGVAVAVSMGNDFACAADVDRGLLCWGDNNYGELGNGSMMNSASPVQVSLLTNGATAPAAGQTFGCAISAGGGVECWGDNSGGILANSTTVPSSVPVLIAGITSGMRAVSVSPALWACALSTSGAVTCWGPNASAALGGPLNGNKYLFQVSGLTGGAMAVSVSDLTACAVTQGGKVQCWGSNGNGELGNGSTTDSSVPVQIMGFASGATAAASCVGVIIPTANSGTAPGPAARFRFRFRFRCRSPVSRAA